MRINMRFDTRDKKPKLYHVLFLTAVVAVILGVLQALGQEAYILESSIVLAVYFAAVIVLLLIAFVQQLQYNPYSYNTILYVGFALFLVSVLITYIGLIGAIRRYPDAYGTMGALQWLTGSAKNYMFFSFPFLAGFSALLIISNISLIRHEGARPVHALGIFLAVVLIGGALLLYRWDYYASGSAMEVMVHDLFTNLFAAVYLYGESMLIGTIIASIIVTRYRPAHNKDFLIILGCGLRADGTPTPLLAGRIDRALTFAREQEEETGKKLVFVTSGGQGPDEVISESASMKNYLLEKGIPAERIVEEDRSTDTLENMRFSKERIGERLAKDAPPAADAGDLSGVRIAFSTTNYHVFRSGICARRVKMRAVGIGAKTRWYFWPNAWVREFAGLLAEHRGKQALILGGLAAIYVALTLAAYL